MTTQVDVIIPTYNCAKYIVQAIKSVINQTYPIHKIIVVDDGSSDNTKQLVAKLSGKYSQIHYLYQKNQGLSSARNLGIKHSQAKYIAFLDSDDTWVNNKIELQIKQFKSTQFECLGIVYCDYNNIDSSGQIISYPSLSLNNSIRGRISTQLYDGNYLTGSGSGVLVKRECFDKCGVFDSQLISCEDWDMWLRIAKKYDVDFVPMKLINIRRSNQSMSQDNGRMAIGMAQLYSKDNGYISSKIAMEYFYRILIRQIIAETPKIKIITQIRRVIGDTKAKKMIKFSLPLVLAILKEGYDQVLGVLK